MSLKSIVVISILFTQYIITFSQETIDVTEQTIKIGGLKEEELYFGFASGDKILFNFQEIDNKELKEIEITEYPNNSKYSDYKCKKIENKTITVNKTGVYIFRFKNSAVSGRICRIKIQRIPASEDTKNFNSAVFWEDKQETTYNTYTKDVLVGYDTIYIPKTKRELVKTEQREELIFDKSQRVHSIMNENGNKTSLFFTLPKNEMGLYKTSKVISWAYWVGVGEDANKAWKQNTQIVGTLVKGAATYYTTPLGALAIGAVFDLSVPKIGEDVYYGLADQANKDLFISGYEYKIFDQGKGVAGYRKFTDPSLCQGNYHIILSNDNKITGIDITAKVVAIVEVKYYEDKPYTETKITPRYEKKSFSDPIVTTHRVPVIGK